MPAPTSSRSTLLGLRHPLLTNIRKGIQKSALTEDGFCIAESFHLLDEALSADREIAAIVVSESVRAAVEGRDTGRTPIYSLPAHDFAGLAATDNSQGVISLIRPPAWTIDQLFAGNALVVVLDGVQDPGNAGTIIRSAEAFGATGVLAIKGTVNLHNPKCLRASAGSVFRVPYVQGAEAAVLLEQNLACYATVASGGQSIYEADLTASAAIVIGSEGRGVSAGLRNSAINLVIPTTGVESLNAAIAASILLCEARHQRSAAR